MLYELYDAARKRRGLDGGLGRRVQSAQQRAAARRLDLGGRRGPADLPAARALPRGRGGADRPRAARDGAARRRRLHPPATHFASSSIEPEPAADGAAPAPAGELQPRGLHRRVADHPASAQALRPDRRRQRLAVVHHRRARTRAGTTKTSNRSSGSRGRHSKPSKAGRSSTPAERALSLAMASADSPLTDLRALVELLPGGLERLRHPGDGAADHRGHRVGGPGAARAPARVSARCRSSCAPASASSRTYLRRAGARRAGRRRQTR